MIWIWIWFVCPAFVNLPPPSGMISYVTVGLLAHPKAPPTMTFMKKSEQPTTEEGALSRNTVGLESCGEKKRQNLGLNPIVSHCLTNLWIKHCDCDHLQDCSQSTVSPIEAPGLSVGNPSQVQKHNHQSQPPGFNSESLTRVKFRVLISTRSEKARDSFQHAALAVVISYPSIVVIVLLADIQPMVLEISTHKLEIKFQVCSMSFAVPLLQLIVA